MALRFKRTTRTRQWHAAVVFAAVVLLAIVPGNFLGRARAIPHFAAAQPQTNQGEDEEVVANLAAGRAMILVGKDGIAVGTLESRAEAETRPPLIVPLGSYRVVVLLGAADWITPDSSRAPLRMDVELRRALGQLAGFNKAQATETFDIEAVGLAFLEPLRAAAARLHHKLSLPADEVLVELLLVQYVEAYGPEVWSIRYSLEQDFLRGDFYRTRVPRPQYLQLYPPDKGQPHTLMETFYPRTGTPLPLLADLLKRNDPRLARLRSADAQLARAAKRLDRGECQKLPVDDALQFLRAALNSVADENARQMIVMIREQKGLEWVAGEEEVAAGPVNDKSREPGAPTLRKKP
jgi:hypothetical protein